ncbi:MAG: site-specific DNA-methyltransferase [Phycisphaerales bacterium]|nr:site-specific DNA-methyltransferase [Phycisphaerales bacterium]
MIRHRSDGEHPRLFDALGKLRIRRSYDGANDVTLYAGDCMELLRSMPDRCADLVVTSPPYNIGKEYETRLELGDYVAQQAGIIRECVRILSDRGSVCWQVGNFVEKGAIIPLDSVLYPVFASFRLRMRNRIIWHFGHGLHCSRRFSGRYEVVMWFTKSDDYVFNLDAVRVPQKYPGKKYFKGARAGEYSCNPLGKNPGDLWTIPNVKHNHVEKTEHPCQFPVELIERLVLSMTMPGSLVVDPFVGVGSTAIAAVRHGRRAAGAELMRRFHRIALERLRLEARGQLVTRPMGRPVYEPGNETVAKSPFADGSAKGDAR